jgi:hypothetical protein
VDVIGSDALERSDVLAVTLGPVARLPLPAPDFDEEAEARDAGDTYTATRVGLGAVGLGLDGAVHAPLASGFTLGGAGRGLVLLPTDYDSVSLEYALRNELREALSTVDPYDTISYRYELDGELRLGFEGDLPRHHGFRVGASLGARYRPEPTVDGAAVEDTDVFALRAGLQSVFTFRLTGTVGLSASLGYRGVLYGKNAAAAHRVSVGTRLDLR